MLEAARDAGMQVIILDPNGNTTPAESDTPAAAEAATEDRSSGLMKIQKQGQALRALLREKLKQMPAALNEVDYILKASAPTGYISDFGFVLLWTLVLFVIGWLFERFVYGQYLAGPYFILPMVRPTPEGYLEKLPFLIARFLAGVLGVLVSMGVAYLIGGLVFGPTNDSAIEFTITVIFAAYFLSRIAALLWRMVLSPFLGQYRLSRFPDRQAMVLYRWMWRIAVLDISVQMFALWLYELGLNHEVYGLFLSLAGLAVALLNIAMVLFNRRAISKALCNGKPFAQVSYAMRFFARVWAPVSIAYIIFAWGRLTFDLLRESETNIPLMAGAYAVILSTLVVFAFINFLIEWFFQRGRRIRALKEAHYAAQRAERDAAESDATTAADADTLAEARMNAAHSGDADEDGDEEGGSAPGPATATTLPRLQYINSYEDLAKRLASILALVAGASVAFNIWGFSQNMMRLPLVERLYDIGTILFLGYLAFHLFRIWIDKKIEDEAPSDAEEVELGDEGGAGSSSRLGTLLPLFRGFILAIIAMAIVLITLLELGINVSPVFAGAGVVGLAIGFGAQTLVRDIFSGAFFLFDDAFRKGEYIDIGSVKGTVEKISVRSFQLRHHLGALHTIPFGEIQFLTNFSRDWVIMKLPLRVTYDTDVERVRKLVKNLGIELLDDPEIGDQFIQPLKSQGVIEMQDSAMIIRVKFMTKPGDQWIIRKRVYQDIRELFEREGIKFAHKEVTVRLAEGKVNNLTEDEKKTLAAGAIDHDEGVVPKPPMDDR
ncbi:mechanosensitive ion channel [Lentibacter algarum]|nr:mechanosensitive ion channel [Lentibacter algarum]